MANVRIDTKHLSGVCVISKCSLVFQLFLIFFALMTMLIVFPWFAIMIAVLAILFGFIYVYFRSAVRELKRMDCITRSVITLWSLRRIV